MFDVLPIDAVPSDVALSPELAEARAEAQQSFRRLEQSQERDSVLSALGRIGKASLKQKVRHRARLVTNSLPQKLPEITTILDMAVDGRNHLVHGSPGPTHLNSSSQTVTALIPIDWFGSPIQMIGSHS
jgi:hypothetical protein